MRQQTPSPLPEDLQALLSAERELPPMPEATRRRADLRARRALWHVREPEPARAHLPRQPHWLRWAVAGVSASSISVAAWMAGSAAFTPTQDASPEINPSQSSTVHDRLQGAPSLTGAISDEAADAPTPELAPPTTTARADATNHRQAPHTPAREAATGHRGVESPGDLELLDAARRAIRVGEHTRALRVLGQHERRFPQSPLMEERDALRVHALTGAGRNAEARRVLTGFEERHPDSVLKPSLKRPSPNSER